MDRQLEALNQLQKAEFALARMLADNAEHGWPDINRSPEATAQRRQALAWAIGSEALEGHAPPETGSFWAKTLQHVIDGNISLTQANSLDDILLGLDLI